MPNQFFIAFACVLCLAQSIKAQHVNCLEYPDYIREAENALAETPKNYVLAVQKYLNATFCNPDSAKIQQIQAKIDGMFVAIERLEVQSKANALRSQRLTRQAKANQEAAQLALRNYFFDEAELQFNKTSPDFRLAYLLSKEALKYDTHYLPAQKLIDTIYQFCPINIDTDKEQQERTDERYIWIKKNRLIHYYQFKPLSDSVFLAIDEDHQPPYFVHLLDTNGDFIWKTFGFAGLEDYDRQQDWLVVYGETNPDYLRPYQIYSLKSRQVIRRGNPVGWVETFPAGLFSQPVLAEHKFEQTLFYTLPDFKLVDSCTFIESRYCESDSLRFFAQANGVLTDSAKSGLELFYHYERRYGEEISKWQPFDTIKFTVVKKDGSIISKNVTALRVKIKGVCGGTIICYNPNEALVLSVPELDTLFFQSPSDFADAYESLRAEEGKDGLVIVGKAHNYCLDVKFIDRKQPSRIILERQNFVNSQPILDERLFLFEFRLPDGPKSRELLAFENRQFKSLGKWQEFKYLEKEKLVLGWSAQKTEVFRLDSTVEKGFHLFPLMELVGGVVNKMGSWSDEIYFWSVWGQEKIYNIITLTADGEYHMSVVDNGYKLLRSLAIGKDVNLYKLRMDEGFLYSYEDPDYQRSISKTYFARPFSNLNTRFIFNEEASHFGNFWVFPSRDEVEEQNFLRIIQITKEKIVRHDSIPYSDSWSVRQVNGKHFLIFDRNGTLFMNELGKFKRPLHHWPGVDSWKFLSETDDPILSIHQNPVIGYIDEETKGVLSFDLAVFNLKNGQTKTYRNKTEKETVWRAKGSDDAPLVSYLEMETSQNDSVWMEIVALPDFETVLPNTLSSLRGEGSRQDKRVEFIVLSETLRTHIRIKQPEVASWLYLFYEFPSMRLVDSVHNVLKMEGLRYESKSNDYGCLVQNQHSNVFYFQYSPYLRKFLQKSDSIRFNIREGVFALPSGGDSLFFYDTYKPDLPLIVTFKHPDIFSDTHIERTHNGFVFTTRRDKSLTVWHYAENAKQFRMLKTGISEWDGYNHPTTLHSDRNSNWEVTTIMVIDSLGMMQLGGQTYPAFLDRKKQDIKPFFFDKDHYWGVVQDTTNQTFLIQLFGEKYLKLEGRKYNYYNFKGSIPNVTRFFIDNQNDKYLKFLTNEPHGNLCLCPEADLPKLNCTYYKLPLENKPLDAILRISEDLLLTFDESEYSKTSEIIVDVFSLSASKKLRSLRLKSDREDYYKESYRWKVSQDGKWLQWDYQSEKYPLLSRDEFDKMMLSEYNFNADEKVEFGID